MSRVTGGTESTQSELRAEVQSLKAALAAAKAGETNDLRYRLAEAQERLRELKAETTPRQEGRKSAFSLDGPGGSFSEFHSWKRMQSFLTNNDTRRGEMWTAVTDALARLSGRQRDVLTMRLQGRSGTEIATRLGVDKSTVSRVEKQAMGNLKRHTALLRAVMECRDADGLVDGAKLNAALGQNLFGDQYALLAAMREPRGGGSP